MERTSENFTTKPVLCAGIRVEEKDGVESRNEAMKKAYRM
jgi:hypothetical protein